MDMETDQGYGYSVWFVPTNHKQLQDQYNMTHIPHITLETNLSLKDAYHIYHNTCKKITIKFRNKFVKFPLLYHHDPKISYGWYVDVIYMTGRKHNWTPHMTAAYLPRFVGYSSYKEQCIMERNLCAPSDYIECFATIADTRSGVTEEWNIDKTYFNIKATQSYKVMFDVNSRKDCCTVASTIDEYIGTNLQSIDNLYNVIKERIELGGIVMNANEIEAIVSKVKKELTRESDMDIDR